MLCLGKRKINPPAPLRNGQHRDKIIYRLNKTLVRIVPHPCKNLSVYYAKNLYNKNRRIVSITAVFWQSTSLKYSFKTAVSLSVGG